MNAPTMLRIRGLENPLNLGPGPIEMSWESDTGEAVWKIQAAKNAEFDIDHLVWESPWHTQTTHLYDGPEPGNQERIFWRVGLKDGEQIAWSEAAWFEAASPAEWRADWLIGPVISQRFDIPGIPVWSRLSVLTQEDAVFIINGEILAILKSDHVNVFDITSSLAEGNNEIIVETGRWVAFQIDAKLDTTLDFGIHSDLDWLVEGGECRPCRDEDLKLP